MMRLPLTVWSYFIASILGLLAFPPLTAAAVMLLLDRHFGTSFFLPSGLVVGEPAAAEHRADRRCSGSTCSGFSAIPRCTC